MDGLELQVDHWSSEVREKSLFYTSFLVHLSVGEPSSWIIQTDFLYDSWLSEAVETLKPGAWKHWEQPEKAWIDLE